MKKVKLPNRRDFLVGGAKFAASLPFLPSLFSYEAEAGVAVRPRLVTFFTPNGQRQEYWAPSVAANVPFAGGKELALSTFASTGISPILGTSFTPYLPLMTLIQGMDFPISMGHNTSAILGHFSKSILFPSIDQVLAKSSKFYGGSTPIINSLNYGRRFSYGYSGTTFSVMPSYDSIQGSFERVFGLGDSVTLQKHANIVEKTLGMYSKLSTSTQLSAADKQMIDAQGTLISELTSRLRTIQPLSCSTPPTKPVQPTGNQDYLTDAVDMVVASMLCGATQVSCIGTDNPNPIAAGGSDWHEPSHTPDYPGAHCPSSLTINKWFAETFYLRMISKMDSIIEANGKSMLYNSVVYWGNELSAGMGHSSENVPIVLAGAAGGKLRTGYLYDYRQYGAPMVATDNAGSQTMVGRPYNQFLVTLLQAMGLSAADYETNGIKGYGANQSGSADRNLRYTQYMPEIGTPLPRFYIG